MESRQRALVSAKRWRKRALRGEVSRLNEKFVEGSWRVRDTDENRLFRRVVGLLVMPLWRTAKPVIYIAIGNYRTTKLFQKQNASSLPE